MTCCCGPKQAAVPRLLGDTESVCPVCLNRIAAQRVAEGDTVVLRKTCPEHGSFCTVIWRGLDSYEAWGTHPAAAAPPPQCLTETSARGCPFDCGLCPDHRQRSCCVLLEVTARCNLACPVCFAQAGGSAADPTLDDIDGWLETLRGLGHPVNIQLSGGEPTLRDDLPSIVAACKAKGFPFVQINTNGIRLSRDTAYVRALKRAGLDCVFLQFDGVGDAAHRVIRGADLFAAKTAAIARCTEERLGVVLVPVLKPGINTDQVGNIIRFAAANVPTVRAVHFQPISYFGRYPGTPSDDDRLTLPEVLRLIETQTDGVIRFADFQPGTAENPYCSFNGQFSILAGGEIRSSRTAQSGGCCPVPGEDAGRARQFVARRWAAEAEAPSCCSPSAGTDAFDAFLAARGESLVISGMVFQDAWTLDLDRLRQCYIHVVSPDRRLVPLCAYNLSNAGTGAALHRKATRC